MYPQRHGCCSLNLLQQKLDGFDDDDQIAPAHELSSEGLQVTASATRAPLRKTAIAATKIQITLTGPTFFIVSEGKRKKKEE